MNLSRRQMLGAAAAAAAAPFAGLQAKEYDGSLKWDKEADVLVVGYGGAGACAAIEAHDAGARVLIIEKMKQGGGNTAVSAGGVMIPTSGKEARTYLSKTYDPADNERDEALLDTFCVEIDKAKAWLMSLREGAELSMYGKGGDYRVFDGWQAVRKYKVKGKGKRSGDLLFGLYQYAVEKRGIEVMLETPAQQLICRNGEVLGVVARYQGRDINIKAKRAVVLTTGSFEYDRQALRTYAMGTQIHALGNPGNTGDGLRMCLSVGAKLWHMTCYSCQLGTELPGCKANQQVSTIAPSFIWVDRRGKRFADEYTTNGHCRGYVVTRFDPVFYGYPQIPCYQIMDDKAIKRGPATITLSGYGINREGYTWSRDNSQELKNGVIVQADTLEALAKKIGIPADQLVKTVKQWNEDIAAGHDTLFDRPIYKDPNKKSMAVSEPLSEKGPYYAIKLWPSLLNTLGGPKRDPEGHILNMQEKPIPRLYGAGELGSIWGSVYQGACNNAECLVFGRLSGRNAAAEKPWA